MKRRNALLLLGLFTFGLLAQGVSAFGMGNGIFRSEEIRDAIESEDFEAFQEAVSELETTAGSRRFFGITEERFQELVERFHLHEDVEAAIDAGDYEAWLAAHEAMGGNSKMTELISEEDFPRFQELHQLREQVRGIEEELEISGLRGQGHVFGHRKGGFGGKGQRTGQGPGNCPFSE
jgi:hypothetical protein